MRVSRHATAITLGIAVVIGLALSTGNGWGQELPAMTEQPPALSPTPPVDNSRMVHVEAELAILKEQLKDPPAPAVAAPALSALECSSPGWYAGYAFSLVKPFFTDPRAALIARRVSSTMIEGDICSHEYDYELTPRVWLGYTGENGLGVRGRYWLYDHDGAPFQYTNDGNHIAVARLDEDILANAANESLRIRNALRTYTVDLELTQAVQFRPVRLQMGAGVREAGTRSYQEAKVDLAGSDIISGQMLQEFEGIGPTLSAELRRPLGQGGLALIAATRGAVLFGEFDQRLDMVDNLTGNQEIQSLHDSGKIIGNMELELGLEWSRVLASGGRLFVRGGYEGQLWIGGGSLEGISGNFGYQGFSFALGLDR